MARRPAATPQRRTMPPPAEADPYKNVKNSEIEHVPLRYTPAKRSVLAELGSLLAYFVAIAAITLMLHYELPAPMETTFGRPEAPITPSWYSSFFSRSEDAAALSMYSPQNSAAFTGGPLYTYFSEGNALLTMQHLSEDIGYRVVGTAEHIEAEEWLEALLRRYEGWHDTGVHADKPYRTRVEVFAQRGDGRHRFDILGHPVWKRYYGMSNLIVRISDGESSLNDSLLLNAHIDSTIPSPGAADDGAGVAIMLEALRVLTLRGAPRMRHSVVLLFNNGEESLQDASHLYMTQHNETSRDVRAVINMEACGVSGPSLLFQATDAALLDAYAKVPHPFGTILAADVFSSGIIMSDTDFRQFVQYGNGLAGLDMAIVGSSYLYHSRKDTPAYLSRGVMQHFGENVFSLIESLTLAEASPLPYIRPSRSKKLLPVYFSMFGRFFVQIAPKVYKQMIIALAITLNFFVSSVTRSERRNHATHITFVSAGAMIAGTIAAAVLCNVVALVLRLIGTPLTWFSNEYLPLLLFTPPTLLGIVLAQCGALRFVEQTRWPYLEYSSFGGSAIVFTVGLMIANMKALGSSYILFVAALAKIIPMIVNDFVFIGFDNIAHSRVQIDQRVHFYSYFFAVVPAAVFGSQGISAFLDLLVPLMGRLGRDAPVDHVMGTLVASLVSLNATWAVPLLHRYGVKYFRSVIAVLSALTVVMVGVFACLPAFDALHPRRLFVHHVENITSGEFHYAMSVVDGVPTFHRLFDDAVQAVTNEPAKDTLSWTGQAHASPDVDIIFPLSHFVDVRRATLPQTPAMARGAADKKRWRDFRITCDAQIDPSALTRNVTLRLHHPGIMWSALSFDADITAWDFIEAPPSGLQHHTLKDISRKGEDDFSVNFTYRIDAATAEAFRRNSAHGGDSLVRAAPGHTPSKVHPWKLRVHYSGLDSNGMFPQHNATATAAQLAMPDLAKLNAYLEEHHPEVDAMLVSVVAGVAEC